MKYWKSCLAAVLVLAAATAFSAEPLLLQWGTIDTSGTEAQAESAALKARVARKAAQARTRKSALPEDRAAYVVQFPGPVTGEWRTWLESATQVRGYLPENAYLVWATAIEMDAIAATPDVFWTGEWKNEYKIVRAGSAPAAKGTASAPARWMHIGSLLTGDDGAADLRARLEALPADVQDAFPRLDGSSAVALLTDARIDEVASWPDIEWIEPQPTPVLFNDQAARTNMMNVSNAWLSLSSGGLGLTGAGQVVAVADTGLDTGNLSDLHADFAGRVTAYAWTSGVCSTSASWMDIGGHGTHVCGSVLGSGAKSSGRYKGMAWEASLVIQGCWTNLSGLPSYTPKLFAQACTNGARIHSDSWGYGTNSPGQYISQSRYVDAYLWTNQNFLAVIAAGNDGIDADGDGVIDPGSVAAPGTAKNCLCVGAAENYRSTGGYATNTYGEKWPSDYPADPVQSDKISSTNTPQGIVAFSARGPTADGRFKPDIVAPGTDVISARSRATTNTRWAVVLSNTNYLYMGGTSMATPLTSGALALVRQWLVERQGIAEPPAALMKALLINGARDMTPGQYGTGACKEITGRPDRSQGFGHVDLCNSLAPGDGSFLLFATNTIADTYGGFETNLLVGTANAGPYRITLAWQDYPGSSAAAKTLVNDLDLIVTSPSGTHFHPNGLDTSDSLNNIESVEFVAAETGSYTVRVYGDTIAETAPHGGQPFALVMSGPVTGEPEAAAPRFAVPSYEECADFGDEFIFDFETLLFVKGWPEPDYDITSSLPDGAWEVADSCVLFTPGSTNDVTFTCNASNTNGTTTCTLTVAIVAEAPSVSVSCADTLSALVGSDVEFTVNATGIPAPVLSVASDPEVEVWFDDSDGEFLFQPAATGTNTFTFTAANPFGSASATVTVIVSSSAVPVPALAVTNVAATSALAVWTPCTGVSTYTLQLASDDQFSTGPAFALSEDFSKVTASNTTAIANLDGATQTPGWSGSQVFSNASQTVRIGTGSRQGWIQTPAFEASGTLSVAWSGCKWSSKDSSTLLLGISDDGGSTFTDTSISISNEMVTRTNVFSLSGTSAAVRWKCSSAGNARFILDDIAISSGGGSSGGSLILSTNVDATSHTFTNLIPETTYYARVKGEADWSNVEEFRTASADLFEQWLADHNASGHAADDEAGNGHTYYQNYIADIDPSSSFLDLTVTDPTSNHFSVSHASSNRWYQLLYTTNLAQDFTLTNDIGWGATNTIFPVEGDWYGGIRVLLEGP
jgi:hypothetical protein